MQHTVLAAFVALAASSAPCQRVQWQLDARSAQFFDRTEIESTVEVLEPVGTDAPKRLNFNSELGRRSPSFLLGGELSPRRRHLEHKPGDLRELPLVLAADLRHMKKGKQEYSLPKRNQSGGIVIQAKFERPDGDRQRIVAKVLPTNPRAGIGRPSTTEWTGTITVVREFDSEAGLLRTIDAQFDLVARRSQNQAKRDNIDTVRFRHHETWSAGEISTADTAPFRAKINDAIRKGGAYIENQLKELNKVREFKAEEPNTHGAGSGYLALAILTGLKAGVDPNGEVMTKALNELRGRNMTNTYCLGTALMALEAYYAPSGERDAILNGTLDGPMDRKPSESDLALMTEWTKRLLHNIDESQDPAYLMRFHYHRNRSWDNSNTQYALLGLYAANLCGVEISPQVWYASSQHFLKTQVEEVRLKTPIHLIHHDELDKHLRGRTSGGRRKVQPMGWGYRDSGPATGSMTTAGITGLVICKAALLRNKKLGRKLRGEMDLALSRGFAWFGQNLTVRNNPRTGGGSHGWHYYYLYGLERSCELSQVAMIQQRDWYFEGATFLLDQHFNRPNVNGLADTCFAVLFLKKAALPAITGR